MDSTICLDSAVSANKVGTSNKGRSGQCHTPIESRFVHKLVLFLHCETLCQFNACVALNLEFVEVMEFVEHLLIFKEYYNCSVALLPIISLDVIIDLVYYIFEELTVVIT